MVAVGAALGGVDQLVGQALGDRLDVVEGGFVGARAQQADSLVDVERGHTWSGTRQIWGIHATSQPGQAERPGQI